MKVLITGGAGFIDSHLTERLLGLGYQVRILDNLSEIIGMEFVRGGCMNCRDVVDPIRDVDVVFHLALVQKLDWSYVTLNLL